MLLWHFALAARRTQRWVALTPGPSPGGRGERKVCYPGVSVYTASMRFDLRVLLFGIVPCFPVLFTLWKLTGEVQVRYPHRDLFLLFRAVLCVVVALAWLGLTRELIKWGRGNATIQRAYLKWLKRRAR